MIFWWQVCEILVKECFRKHLLLWLCMAVFISFSVKFYVKAVRFASAMSDRWVLVSAFNLYDLSEVILIVSFWIAGCFFSWKLISQNHLATSEPTNTIVITFCILWSVLHEQVQAGGKCRCEPDQNLGNIFYWPDFLTELLGPDLNIASVGIGLTSQQQHLIESPVEFICRSVTFSTTLLSTTGTQLSDLMEWSAFALLYLFSTLL